MIKKRDQNYKQNKFEILYTKIVFLIIIAFLFVIIKFFQFRNFQEGKFPVINLTENMNLVKKKQNEKVVAMIFAGRKNYIEILMKYLLFLIEKGKLDEVHFWLFTDTVLNFGYISSISNLHKTSKVFTSYLQIYPEIIENKVELSLKGDGNAFILINNKIEIVIDAENEELKQNITLGFSGEKLIFIDNIINNKSYTNITLILTKNKDLIIESKNKILKKINTKHKLIKSIEIHSGFGKEVYWDYTEVNNIGIKSFDSEIRAKFRWFEAYKFYLNYNYSVFLKMDDDIVFIDVNRFDNYIKYIKNNPNKNAIFPNIINHCVSLFYNKKNGLIPDEILLDEFRNQTTAIGFFNCFSSAEMGNRMHYYFLNNAKTFLNCSFKPISLNDHKESVSFLGVAKKNYIKLFNPKTIQSRGFCADCTGFDDEGYIFGLKKNYLFPNFVVAHYAFGPQREKGIDKNGKILNRYKALANNIIN